MAHMTAPEYISEAFGYFTEIGMENIRLLKSAVGADGIDILEVSATDFGTQNGPLMSVDMYREFYKPHHKKINDWVHRNTGWKTFIHCCGVIDRFIDDFIEAGFDILNPVQINDGRCVLASEGEIREPHKLLGRGGQCADNHEFRHGGRGCRRVREKHRNLRPRRGLYCGQRP
jgi:uroporphyrinogen-III decarboxylase